ncbi:GNAT family N-acetyltransferase [Knoellia subterranea]|uniref:Acetyltransferase n=1 Tax=Knoellia subterranea KCTC 19937 TaxID=1385521 RepID=A0A0A0JMW3_9MICO|nr:GNAT family protein [Knoellia subterranea]KGN37402.1 acetyltransferase [Knoellia subterranea KCTC 19937]
MTADFATKPTLEGSLVTLRPIRAEDADLIDAMVRADPEIARLTGSANSSSEEPAAMPLEKLREIYGGWAEADDRLVLGVEDRASGELVGEVVLAGWDEGNRSSWFRTLIGAAGRGRGLGTEATRLIVGYGFEALDLHRITLEVYDFNPRGRHVYEKVGFVHEGTGREALLFDDAWVDVHYMGLLASDWSRGSDAT